MIVKGYFFPLSGLLKSTWVKNSPVGFITKVIAEPDLYKLCLG